MKRRQPPPDINLATWKGWDKFKKNRTLLDWLSHDERRAQLYEAVNRDECGVLAFPSIAREYDPNPDWREPPDTAPREAFLVTKREWVEQALSDQTQFSNSPYAELGTGSFMLAIDKLAGPQKGQQPTCPQKASERRDLHVKTAQTAFTYSCDDIEHLCDYAFTAVMPTALRSNAFDLADLAEQAALRFSCALFGFSAGDYPLLEDALRKGYQALNYQLLGRHFVSEPLTLVEAKLAMGKLLARTSVLIDEYQWNDERWPQDVSIPAAGLESFKPVMKKLGETPGGLTGEECAVLVVGSLVGIVGNVQASVCIAIEALFQNQLRDQARKLTFSDKAQDSTALWALLAEGLRLNPPVAFVPRRAAATNIQLGRTKIPLDADCVLALGSAAQTTLGTSFNRTSSSAIDPLVFGLDAPTSSPRGIHWCLGKHLAKPLIQSICAGVLRLDSLAERLDPGDGEVIGLQKRWGFKCLSYPMQHRRDLRFEQQPLNVVMRVKSPISANAEAIRSVIRVGAPRIEQVLTESRHVHFAWFEFIDNDSKLVLHTVFDGDFNAYLQHFALKVGDVFDRLFRYIEDAPPLPVDEFPAQFIETIRRFNRPAVEGFFYSAYPRAGTAQIRRWQSQNP